MNMEEGPALRAQCPAPVRDCTSSLVIDREILPTDTTRDNGALSAGGAAQTLTWQAGFCVFVCTPLLGMLDRWVKCHLIMIRITLHELNL